MGHEFNFSHYSPVGDLTVLSICLVIIILVFFSYINRSKNFRIFLSVVALLMLSALANVSFFSLVERGYSASGTYAYALRCVFHALLFIILMHFVIYIAEAARLEKRRRTLYISVAAVLLVVIVTCDVLLTFTGRSMNITDEGMSYRGKDIFVYGYLVFIALIILLMYRVRTRLYRRVMLGFYGTMCVSFIMLLLQVLNGQSSFTVASFLYPTIAMFYILHSNPYDAALGALDSRALENFVKYNYETKSDFYFVSVYLRSFAEEGTKIPE